MVTIRSKLHETSTFQHFFLMNTLLTPFINLYMLQFSRYYMFSPKLNAHRQHVKPIPKVLSCTQGSSTWESYDAWLICGADKVRTDILTDAHTHSYTRNRHCDSYVKLTASGLDKKSQADSFIIWLLTVKWLSTVNKPQATE